MKRFLPVIGIAVLFICCFSLIGSLEESSYSLEKLDESDSQVIETTDFGDYADTVSELIKNGEELPSGKIDDMDPCYTKRLIVKGKDDSISFQEYPVETIIKGPDDVTILQFSTVEETKVCMEELSKNPKVEYVEPDMLYGIDTTSSSDVIKQASKTPAGSIYKSWGVKKMEADKYAKYLSSNKKASVTVAVVDTGVSEHPFLKGRILKTGYDFIDKDKNPGDKDGHGTHVAGTIVDCTPKLNVKILPVRVLNDAGRGTSVTIGNGIKYAADKGAKVINMSLGGGHSKYIDETIDYAIKKGAVVVVAAGNEYENVKYSCPAHNPKCITVAAMDSKEKRADFSNFGSTVDVIGPGVDILSCIPGKSYQKASGTSMAAPHISAVVAMIRLGYPSKTPADVEKTLKNITKDLGAKGWDKYFGYGLPKLTKMINAKSIKMSQSSATLKMKSRLKLTATVLPGGFVTWSTSNKTIAAVDDNGIVTGKKMGKVTITAKTINGLKASCKVEVLSDKAPIVKPKEIRINQSKVTMDAGSSVTLIGTIKPDNTTDKEIAWKSSNEMVAEVSDFGTVTAYHRGTAVITATTTNGLSAVCHVTVTGDSVLPSGITLNQKKIKVLLGETALLWATISPETATDKRLKWSSSNSNLEISQDGEIKAIKAGVSTVKVTTSNLLYDECEVTILDPAFIVEPKELLLSPELAKIQVGEVVYLSAAVKPENATDPTVTFSSNNTLIADVTSSGKVTGRMEGSTVITVRTSNRIKKECWITVEKPVILPKEITLNSYELNLDAGKNATLTATITPADVTDKKLTWESSNTSVASVYNDGFVKAYKEGKTVITVKTSNGLTASCVVNVKPRPIVPTSIWISKWSVELDIGGKMILEAIVSPEEAADSPLTWESSDESIAKVDKNGLITGIKEGSVRITAKTSNGISDYCSVTVKAGSVTATDISLDQKEMQLSVGKRTTLTAKITPENTIDKRVAWKSSDNEIAGVDGRGNVFAYKAGKAVITAKSSNGLTASCTVTVTEEKVLPTDIVLNYGEAELKIGQKLVLTATVKPTEATDGQITWESSDRSIADVSLDGTVTGVGEGNAVITAKTSNGVSATCTISIKSDQVPADFRN